MGGGGFAFGGVMLGEEAEDCGIGRNLFFNAEMAGFDAVSGAVVPGRLGIADGGFGAAFGGRGAEPREVSGSER